MIACSFIASGVSVNVESHLKVDVGVDHAPVPNITIEKKGVWGL
jgi:hypothetical protein